MRGINSNSSLMRWICLLLDVCRFHFLHHLSRATHHKGYMEESTAPVIAVLTSGDFRLQKDSYVLEPALARSPDPISCFWAKPGARHALPNDPRSARTGQQRRGSHRAGSPSPGGAALDQSTRTTPFGTRFLRMVSRPRDRQT